jgi:hypothetical protein
MAQSQVSIEFLILIGVASLTLMVFLNYASDSIRDISIAREQDAIRDVGFAVQNELFVATQVEDGYLRYFDVPLHSNGVQYNISIIPHYLVLTSSPTSWVEVFRIPLVTGNVTLGDNNITRRGGVIYLNR